MRAPLPAAKLGLAAGVAGYRPAADCGTVLAGVVGVCPDRGLAIGLAVLARIYLRAETDKQRKDLRLIVVLTAFSLLFWAFAQQGGSSISLYIDRFVNRHIMSYEVPTAMFQSINAFAVMLCGMVLAWLVKESVNGNRTVRIWGNLPSVWA